MIRAELRDLCEEHVGPELLAWLKCSYPNVWARPMVQLCLPELTARGSLR